MTNYRSFGLAIILALFPSSPFAAHAQRGARVAGLPAAAGRVAPSRGALPRVSSVRPAARPGARALAHADHLVPGFNFTGAPAFFPDGRHNGHFAFDRSDRRFRDRDFFPGDGFLLWDGVPEYAAPPDTGDYAQPDQTQQPEQAEPSPPENAVEEAPLEQPESVPSAGPVVPGNDHVTLVLRNGHQIQAFAFTRSNDSIVYITSSGLRRTLALSDLDTDATLRVNQEQGTFLQPSSL